ncbi:hypothetical protein Vretifemale_951, partial [Volvox reticuliferus]
SLVLVAAAPENSSFLESATHALDPSSSLEPAAVVLEPSSSLEPVAAMPEPSSFLVPPAAASEQLSSLESVAAVPEQLSLLEPVAAVPEQLSLLEPVAAVPEQLSLLEPVAAVPEQLSLLEPVAAVPEQLSLLEPVAAVPEPSSSLERRAVVPEPSPSLEPVAAVPEPWASLERRAVVPEPSPSLEPVAAVPEPWASLEPVAAVPEPWASLESVAAVPEQLSLLEPVAAVPEPESSLERRAVVPEPSSSLEPAAAVPEPWSSLEPVAAVPEQLSLLEPVAAVPEPSSSLEPAAAVPEPWSSLEPVAAVPEQLSLLEPVAAVPEPSPSLEPVAALPEPSSSLEPAAAVPEPWSSLEPVAAVPEPSSSLERRAVVPEPSPSLESVAAVPEPSSSLEPIAAVPEPWSSLESVAAVPEPWSSLESVAAVPEPESSLERRAVVPEPSSSLEPAAAVPEPWSSLEPVAAVPEQLSLLEPVAAVPEPSPSLEPVAAVPEPSSSLEPAAAVPEPWSSLEPVAAVPEPSSSLERRAVVPEPSPSLESVAAVPEPSPSLEPVAVVPEPSPSLESVAAVPEQLSLLEPVATVPEPWSSLESVAAVPEPESSLERRAVVPEPSPSLEPVAAVPEPWASLEPVAAVPEQLSLPEPVAAVPEPWASLERRAVVPEPWSSLEPVVAVPEPSPSLERRAVVPEPSPSLESVAAVPEPWPSLESVAAVPEPWLSWVPAAPALDPLLSAGPVAAVPEPPSSLESTAALSKEFLERSQAGSGEGAAGRWDKGLKASVMEPHALDVYRNFVVSEKELGSDFSSVQKVRGDAPIPKPTSLPTIATEDTALGRRNDDIRDPAACKLVAMDIRGRADEDECEDGAANTGQMAGSVDSGPGSPTCIKASVCTGEAPATTAHSAEDMGSATAGATVERAGEAPASESPFRGIGLEEDENAPRYPLGSASASAGRGFEWPLAVGIFFREPAAAVTDLYEEVHHTGVHQRVSNETALVEGEEQPGITTVSVQRAETTTDDGYIPSGTANSADAIGVDVGEGLDAAIVVADPDTDSDDSDSEFDVNAMYLGRAEWTPLLQRNVPSRLLSDALDEGLADRGEVFLLLTPGDETRAGRTLSRLQLIEEGSQEGPEDSARTLDDVSDVDHADGDVDEWQRGEDGEALAGAATAWGELPQPVLTPPPPQWTGRLSAVYQAATGDSIAGSSAMAVRSGVGIPVVVTVVESPSARVADDIGAGDAMRRSDASAQAVPNDARSTVLAEMEPALRIKASGALTGIPKPPTDAVVPICTSTNRARSKLPFAPTSQTSCEPVSRVLLFETEPSCSTRRAAPEWSSPASARDSYAESVSSHGSASTCSNASATSLSKTGRSVRAWRPAGKSGLSFSSPSGSAAARKSRDAVSGGSACPVTSAITAVRNASSRLQRASFVSPIISRNTSGNGNGVVTSSANTRTNSGGNGAIVSCHSSCSNVMASAPVSRAMALARNFEQRALAPAALATPDRTTSATATAATAAATRGSTAAVVAAFESLRSRSVPLEVQTQTDRTSARPTSKVTAVSASVQATLGSAMSRQGPAAVPAAAVAPLVLPVQASSELPVQPTLRRVVLKNSGDDSGSGSGEESFGSPHLPPPPNADRTGTGWQEPLTARTATSGSSEGVSSSSITDRHLATASFTSAPPSVRSSWAADGPVAPSDARPPAQQPRLPPGSIGDTQSAAAAHMWNLEAPPDVGMLVAVPSATRADVPSASAGVRGEAESLDGEQRSSCLGEPEPSFGLITRGGCPSYRPAAHFAPGSVTGTSLEPKPPAASVMSAAAAAVQYQVPTAVRRNPGGIVARAAAAIELKAADHVPSAVPPQLLRASLDSSDTDNINFRVAAAAAGTTGRRRPVPCSRIQMFIRSYDDAALSSLREGSRSSGPLSGMSSTRSSRDGAADTALNGSSILQRCDAVVTAASIASAGAVPVMTNKASFMSSVEAEASEPEARPALGLTIQASEEQLRRQPHDGRSPSERMNIDEVKMEEVQSATGHVPLPPMMQPVVATPWASPPQCPLLPLADSPASAVAASLMALNRHLQAATKREGASAPYIAKMCRDLGLRLPGALERDYPKAKQRKASVHGTGGGKEGATPSGMQPGTSGSLYMSQQQGRGEMWDAVEVQIGAMAQPIVLSRTPDAMLSASNAVAITATGKKPEVSGGNPFAEERVQRDERPGESHGRVSGTWNRHLMAPEPAEGSPLPLVSTAPPSFGQLGQGTLLPSPPPAQLFLQPQQLQQVVMKAAAAAKEEVEKEQQQEPLWVHKVAAPDVVQDGFCASSATEQPQMPIVEQEIIPLESALESVDQAGSGGLVCVPGGGDGVSASKEDTESPLCRGDARSPLQRDEM